MVGISHIRPYTNLAALQCSDSKARNLCGSAPQNGILDKVWDIKGSGLDVMELRGGYPNNI